VDAEAQKQAQPKAAAERSPTDPDGITLRQPRQVRWQLWRRVERTGQVTLVREGTAAVVDATCPIDTLKFRHSLWARRTVKATTSDTGVLAELDTTATSTAAAVAAAAGNAGASISAGVKTGATSQAGSTPPGMRKRSRTWPPPSGPSSSSKRSSTSLA
jgi:hypothetical protein